MKVKVEMRRSKIHGNGVFAITDIKKGEPIMEYKGRLISHEEADERYATDLETGHTFLFILNKEWVIDAGRDGNDARWINTGCEPNGEAFVHEHKGKDRRKDKVIIEARRDIKAGEEITYDYGIKLGHPPTQAELEAWTCRCGSPKCRGTMLKWRKPRKAVPKARTRQAA
jgi:SET domain-containing protein